LSRTAPNIFHSFERLAERLAHTDKTRCELENLKKIGNFDEKKEKLIQFVKENLKTHPHWLLLYDNVENLVEIQKYFPQDPLISGKGKVLITTRDSNVRNHKYVTASFPINELTSDEKFNLFNKILNQDETPFENHSSQEETKAFLEQLPSFPLDVSVAAYYIKTTKVSYANYLEKLHSYNDDFSKLQESILAETGDYTKVRYNIVMLSLEKLLQTNKEFGELLFFISLLNAQGIPIDLLKSYKQELMVESFIHNLQKYSLIEHTLFSKNGVPTFSFHRDVQEAFLIYFTKIFNLNTNQDLLLSFIRTLEQYTESAFKQGSLEKLKLLIMHYKIFLSHGSWVTDSMKASMYATKGYIYIHLNYYEKALNNLKKSLLNLEKSALPNDYLKAKVLVHLGIATKKLGDREKAKLLIEEALNIYQTAGITNPEEIGRALLNLGDIYRLLGDYQTSRELLERSLSKYAHVREENSPNVARALLYLGVVHKELGHYVQAKAILEESLFIYRTKLSHDHLRLARVLTEIGHVEKELGDFEKAKELTQQSLAIYQKNLEPDHIDIAWVLSYLAQLYNDLGNYTEAKNLLEKSLAVHRNHYSETHPEVAWVLLHLGNTYKNMGLFSEAQRVLEESLASHELYYGKNHLETARVLVNIGDLYALSGSLKKSETALYRALKIYKLTPHPDQVRCLKLLTKWDKKFKGESSSPR
ncbi:MAG: tetratricopeptide repeat protein, partial [Proteobacteria bacterium]|nr:tetratricopeptide repeat protein [Pseudomonadota bacterium]